MSFEIENGVLKRYIPEDNETEVVIPDTVTSIGEKAFRGCDKLTAVDIPDSVKQIGKSAFLWCERLESVTIPDSVTVIEEATFQCCIRLKSVTIPDSVTVIGKNAFEDCFNLTSVTIPDSVTEIGMSAFSGTKWFDEYPDDWVVAGDGFLIEYRRNEENVVIPETVKRIGKYAFKWCHKLESLTIPNSVTVIGEEAFRCCSKLRTLTLPGSVTEICSGAFCFCQNLTVLNIPNSVTSIGGSAFEQCERLSTVTISGSLTYAGRWIFSGCSSLTPVVRGIKFRADCEKFSKDIEEALNLPQTRNFSAKLYTPLKTAVITGYYLESGDTDAEAYIKKRFTRIMKFLIDEDNPEPILRLLETGKFVTARNIMTYIDYASEHGRMEIQLIFMNYSHEHFKPNKTNFKL